MHGTRLDRTFSELPSLLDLCPSLTFCNVMGILEEDCAKFMATFLLKYENYLNPESSTKNSENHFLQINTKRFNLEV